MRKGQGAFEYMLLLAGVLSIATVAFFFLRGTASDGSNRIGYANCKLFLINVNTCYHANQTWKPDTTTPLNDLDYGMDPKCTVDGEGGLSGTQYDVVGTDNQFYCGSKPPG